MSTTVKIIGIVFSVIGFGVTAFFTYEYQDASMKMGTNVMSSPIATNFLEYGVGGVIFAGFGIGIFWIGVKI